MSVAGGVRARVLWVWLVLMALAVWGCVRATYVADLSAPGNDISAAHPLLIECMVVKLAQVPWLMIDVIA